MSLEQTNPELYKFFSLILERISPQEEIIPPIKDKMIKEMEEQFNLFLNEKYLENMSEEAQNEYLELLQSSLSPQTVNDFIMENVQNVEQVVQTAAVDFANIYIDAANEQDEEERRGLNPESVNNNSINS